ncbi:TIGR02922 family protein [Colwellia hornerae]|uniref:TIGR02922 family protein n=1 Tax=Colwellia hornerae TaxID=89402 RepID=A0A5C6QEB3_9GAMM|nr:TIGR02922 family protein [Colwellia hornerae]TWX59407.1 TIGR02922 family protein [Colwellia hornerae]TWX62777.1 TIGR02922 family protein [Colwellia hornerae]TWX67091.1 TIGR02922 family protein [Colwellia hornerae]
MQVYQEKIVTLIYYSDDSLELLHKIESFLQSAEGRVVIPESFKKGKSIIAVCEGEINIMNKVGDRIVSAYGVI